MNIKNLNQLEVNLDDTEIYPVLLLDHGTPIDAVENNKFTKEWADLKTKLPTHKVVNCISAHLETRGTYITSNMKPRTTHDFYGFSEIKINTNILYLEILTLHQK